MPNQNSPNQPGSGVQGPQTTSAAQTPATPATPVNTQPTTGTDVSQNFEVRTVNPPLTPDQIIGIQEAPIQQQLPTLKLQKIEESQVKSKTLVGHLKAIEAKMIATEKLLEDVVKLQNLQIVTQKELHFRKKELYQNTFEEYLLDKTIDFGKKKKKDCTCISLPDTPPAATGVPIVAPGAPTTAPATQPSTAPATQPSTAPATQPSTVPVSPIFQPGPGQTMPFPAPTPTPPTTTPPVQQPGWRIPAIPPFPIPMPEDLLPPVLGTTPLSTPVTAQNPLTLPSPNPYDVQFSSDTYGGSFTESKSSNKPKASTYEPLAYKPFISIIEGLKKPNITEKETADLLKQAVAIGTGLQMAASTVMRLLQASGAIGATAIGLPNFAKGGIPGADLELYSSESQRYFKNISNYAAQIASDVPVGPHTPLPHPGYVRPQGSFIPKPNLRGMPGPMGNPMPWGYDPTRMLAKGGLVKPYADGGWLPGTGRVMAPKTVGNTTIAGYQNKFLGFNIGKPEYPTDSSGYNTGYSQAERTRYEKQNPKKHFVNSGGAFPELVNRRNLIGEAFANFGSNINTIKSRAKRQEEMMREMGYEPDGYVNLLGQPIKKKAGGGISLGGGIRFGGESSGLRQGSYATGSASTSIGKMQTSAGFAAGNAETIEGRSASAALDQALYNIQASTPMIAPDGKEYYGPYMPELTIKPEIKEGLFGTIDVQAQTSFGESPSTSGPEDEDPEMTRNPKNPRSYILSRGGLRPAKSKSPARVSPTPTRVPPSNRLESGQSALRPTGGKPPVIPLPPQTIPIPSRKPSSKVGYDSPNTMDQMPSMFSRSNSVLR